MTLIPADQPAGPQRTCVGCRRTRSQTELVRVVRTPDGTLWLGRTLPGRGAWLCQSSPSCLDLAAQRGGFARSFRVPVSASAIGELRSAMAADLET